MVRAVFVGVLAAALFAGPVIALAQTDMVTYGDTMRKTPTTHPSVRPVTRGSVSSADARGARHTTSAQHASARHAASARSGPKHGSAKAKHHK
jgi:hypothetical protein